MSVSLLRGRAPLWCTQIPYALPMVRRRRREGDQSVHIAVFSGRFGNRIVHESFRPRGVRMTMDACAATSTTSCTLPPRSTKPSDTRVQGSVTPDWMGSES